MRDEVRGAGGGQTEALADLESLTHNNFATQGDIDSVNAVLDGISLLPGRLDLEAYAGRAHVIFLVVATFDEDAFRARFSRRGEGAADRPPHRYLGHLPEILRIQDHILELADAHGVPIVENVSFDRAVLSIIRYVTESVAKAERADAAAPE